jgi:hypothetical protein
MCCAQDSSEKRGTDTFLPGRFDQGFIRVTVAGSDVEAKASVTVGRR